MVVEHTINVGFYSNFGAFQRRRHSKTHTRSAITNGFPCNPTYDSQNSITNLAQFSFFDAENLDAFPLAVPGRCGRDFGLEVKFKWAKEIIGGASHQRAHTKAHFAD